MGGGGGSRKNISRKIARPAPKQTSPAIEIGCPANCRRSRSSATCPSQRARKPDPRQPRGPLPRPGGASHRLSAWCPAEWQQRLATFCLRLGVPRKPTCAWLCCKAPAAHTKHRPALVHHDVVPRTSGSNGTRGKPPYGKKKKEHNKALLENYLCRSTDTQRPRAILFVQGQRHVGYTLLLILEQAGKSVLKLSSHSCAVAGAPHSPTLGRVVVPGPDITLCGLAKFSEHAQQKDVGERENGQSLASPGAVCRVLFEEGHLCQKVDQGLQMQHCEAENFEDRSPALGGEREVVLRSGLEALRRDCDAKLTRLFRASS